MNGFPQFASAVSENGSSSTAAPTSADTQPEGHTTAATSAAHSANSPAEHPNGYTEAAGPSSNTTALLQHIHQNGFCNALWHDCILHFHSIEGFTRTFQLHTLLLSRSPLLREILMSTQLRTLVLKLEDPNITEEALAICLGHLYGGASSALVNASNASAVLATAYYLQLDELCQIAHTVCKQSLSGDNVGKYVAFSKATIQSPSSSTAVARYGTYSESLAKAATEYLAETLPLEVGAFTSPPKPGGQETLIAAYSSLDFELFRSIAQSPAVQSRPTQELFSFLKRCVLARKKKLGTSLGEEQVVLAFAGKGSGNVQVLRKPTKKLAKIGPHAST